ncbi:hypothetical protein CK226_09975 [Mesorhizobium sp. WSM4311]|nr:hypothetical protein CK226_09975 [Mesorhizobium sp. WSM4311]
MFDGNLVDVEILESGVKVYCKGGGTDVCDAFLEDLVSAAIRFGVKFEETPDFRIYSSAIEFEMDGNYDALFSRINAIGGLIGGCIASYGGPGDSYRGIGLSFIGLLQGPAPDPFRIERRANHPMDSNVFFSIAPLRNADHLNVLREFERLIS